LNRLPELKSFLKDGDVETYRGVEPIEWIKGREAVLTVYRNGVEAAAGIKLSEYKTKDDLHRMMLEQGFTKKSPDEIERIMQQVRKRKEEEAEAQRVRNEERRKKMEEAREKRRLEEEERRRLEEEEGAGDGDSSGEQQKFKIQSKLHEMRDKIINSGNREEGDGTKMADEL